MKSRAVIRIIALLALVIGGTGFLFRGELLFGLAMYAVAVLFAVALLLGRKRPNADHNDQ